MQKLLRSQDFFIYDNECHFYQPVKTFWISSLSCGAPFTLGGVHRYIYDVVGSGIFVLLYGVLCVVSKGYADFAVVVGEHKERDGEEM